MDGDFWLNILYFVLTVAGPPLLGLIGWSLKKLVDWVDSKIENEWISGMIQRSRPVLIEFVDGIYKSGVKPLKAAGKWTPEAAAQAKQDVVNELKSWIGTRGLASGAKVLGGSDKVEALVSGLVEDVVTERKTVGRRAKSLKPKKSRPRKKAPKKNPEKP